MFFRSPQKVEQFKIPNRPRPNINVYSQVVNDDDNTYINVIIQTYSNLFDFKCFTLQDSFCVDLDDDEETQLELSELELAERKLKEMRANKQKKSKKLGANIKRRRIVQVISSEESD